MLEQVLIWLGFTLALTLPCIIIYALMAKIIKKLNAQRRTGTDK
jgi:hypothetical protein